MKICGIEFNADENNVVLQTNGDGGDALARTGNVFQWTGMVDANTDFKLQHRAMFEKALKALEVPGKPGDYVRYNKGEHNNPKDMSRDNKMQAVMAMGVNGMLGRVMDALWADLKRFGRTPNGDVLFLGEYAIYIRAIFSAMLEYFVPLEKGKSIQFFLKAAGLGLASALMTLALIPLAIFDLSLVVNVLIIALLKGREPGPVRRWLADKGLYFLVQDYPKSVNPNNPDSWSRHGKYNVGDDVLLRRSLSIARRYLATPTSWLARKLYVWFRPTYKDVPYNGIDLPTGMIYRIRDCDSDVSQYSDDVYYMPSSGANPINDLYRPTNEEDFS